ncbi:disulfide bond formation protein B [Marivita sp.]|uniref:disulfide bond formation protein B n=1 Tax=Marivita sp. TaxID=2003365 RepID=UPI0025C52162|nr:disulfide bond formation protein B [Marivita sp.]
MISERQFIVVLAAGGSLALLLGAFAFQHIGGMAPCALCIWQRYPHAVAVAIGLVALRFGTPALAWLGALAALTSAGIGVYHTGVERGWWDGPSTCSAGEISGLTTDELFDEIMSAPLVRCDEVPWDMLGLSMASWNAVASLVLALLWVAAARRAA